MPSPILPLLSPCFIAASPLLLQNRPALSSTTTFTSTGNTVHYRRPRHHPRPPPFHRGCPSLCSSLSPPPPLKETLSSALQEISSFNGTQAEGKALAKRLIDTLVTAPSLPNKPSKDTPPNQPFVEDNTPNQLLTALRDASLLRAFSSARPPPVAPVAQKSVSAARLAAQAGLPLSALSPRRGTVLGWQLAGVAAVSAVVMVSQAAGMERLAGPLLFLFAVLFAFDNVALRGAVFESTYRALFPRYAEKVLKHEAGHFLAAYLHGLAVRGYVLSAGEAIRAGIPGQAGTLFSDDEMYAQLGQGKLTNRSIDRYSIVSMAGIAAEAINYGEAEGGASDVASLVTLLTTLQPPWAEQNVRSQARWAVLEAIMLLRRNEQCFEALCNAMRERKSLGECMQCIEENFVPIEPPLETESTAAPAKNSEAILREREKAIVAELERIRMQVKQMEEQ